MSKAFAGWKYAIILAIILVAALLALPNWFGKSPTVQMQFATPEAAASSASEITTLLHDAHIDPSHWKQDGQNLNLFFTQTDIQIQARDLLTAKYPDNSVSVNLLPNTPEWLQSIGLSPMNLGLDLRGGISFLLQVDSNELFTRKSAELIDLATATAEKNAIKLAGAEAAPKGGAVLSFNTADDREKTLSELYRLRSADIEQINFDENGQYRVRLQYTEAGISQMKRRAAEQNRVRMSSRVNSLGVAEPSIQVVDDDRLLIQLPGIQDVAKAKEMLGSTATLEFYIVDERGDVASAARMKRAPFGSKLAYFEDGTPILLKRKVVMSGEHIVDALANATGQSGIAVSVALDSAGGAQMAEVTHENLKKPMATVYVEYVPITKTDASGKTTTVVEKHETVVNSATIQSEFASNFEITGVTPLSRAQKLASTLRAGSLVAPVYIIEERTIGPNAGKKNIDQGIHASALGLLFIVVFMLVYYRKLGLFANIALIANLILLLALMSLLGATLTLPGIAGIVLTLGMAVDANVLIYERIREELHLHLETRQAVRLGFDNALSTIVDANITTLIVAVLLFSFGAGPIKGFAVTLSLGILTTMFTAIYVTRALVEFFMLRKANPQIKM
ncbi:MAG: protein translocase subunit SecD [Cardiobacteriaceae bacterium]|nr:protein translocase subunit SecD [Cardiobacteriaceae bacterium]